MAEPGLGSRTIREAARETKVCYEADVVVVGGGPGGHSAAVAAARNGASAVLVERYGHLGGMSTGGLVLMLHNMSDGTETQLIAGLCQEWIDRLDARDACVHPKKEEIGSGDKELLNRWQSPFFAIEGRLIFGARGIDPEILKCVLNDMTEEAGVKLFLHSWGTQTIVDNGEVKGIIFESKSGRQAILAKVVIDGTGDGDLLPLVGEEFDCNTNLDLRTNKAAMCFEFANVDLERVGEFRQTNPQKYAELMQEVVKLNGFTPLLGGTSRMRERRTREGVVHFNMFLPGLDVLNVEDLTRIEVNTRKRMLITYDFMRKYVPGFEKSFIMLTAPQLGIRGSRRLVGEYVITEQDTRAGTVFEDTIAVFPPLNAVLSPEHPRLHIPYRSLLPRKVDGLLVAGRSFSSDDVINEYYNTISHCIAMGQAAGTASALAIKSGTKLRDVDHSLLQERLIAQGVQLPGLVRA
ncbi:FAD-dependent oxidoreductase [Chloroflexota bacterium]